MLNNKVNEELKLTENDSDVGGKRRFDWSNDSHFFMQIPLKTNVLVRSYLHAFYSIQSWIAWDTRVAL